MDVTYYTAKMRLKDISNPAIMPLREAAAAAREQALRPSQGAAPTRPTDALL